MRISTFLGRYLISDQKSPEELFRLLFFLFAYDWVKPNLIIHLSFWFISTQSLLALISNMWSKWSQSSVLDEAVIAICTIFFPAIFQRYFKNIISRLTAQRLYSEKISSTVDAHSLNSNKSVMTCMVFFFFLLFVDIILAYPILNLISRCKKRSTLSRIQSNLSISKLKKFLIFQFL